MSETADPTKHQGATTLRSDSDKLRGEPFSVVLVRRIQQWRIPGSRRGESDGIPWIAGLDTVLLGSQPASEVVQVCNVRPPQYAWYMLSGGICDVLQLAMDFLIHLYVSDASVCWALSFFLSIVARHTTHRYLVFGNYVGGYWNSLFRMYAGYSVIIVLSTAFNVVMTRGVELPHYVAWICTLLWTGVVNFFILKKLWSFGGTPPPARRDAGRAFVSKVSDSTEMLPLAENIHKPRRS